ncbi:Asp/Glu/Hydantoin racemase-domain-containing protein [Butyriboletus roseoflavus]|nr:Asp/Glu/Hydantoin racemase-domain-containing protein [Butyriboletus roseoflavus]
MPLFIDNTRSGSADDAITPSPKHLFTTYPNSLSSIDQVDLWPHLSLVVCTLLTVIRTPDHLASNEVVIDCEECGLETIITTFDPTPNMSNSSSQVTVCWLEPLGNDSFHSDIANILSQIKRPDTKVEIVSFDIPNSPIHLEYLCYQALMSSLTIKCARNAGQEGIDTMIIGCFYDPDLETSREISGSTVVVAPCHSTLTVASRLANKFSIIVGRDKWVQQMKERIKVYGMKDLITSFRELGLGVDDFQKFPELTRKRIMEEAQKAVKEDGAEAIILGCTMEFGFFKEVQEKVGVPVIDAVVAPFLDVEHAAHLKKQFNWKPSRVGSCAPPPKEELRKFGIFQSPAPHEVHPG